MHMPERWGYVQFSGMRAGAGTEPFVEDPNERVIWALRRLYYRQRRIRAAGGSYAATLDALDATDIRVDGLEFRPVIQATGVALRDQREGIQRQTWSTSARTAASG